MSTEIDQHYKNAFKSGITGAFQQLESKFRDKVEVGRQEGEFDYEDRVGIAEDVNEVTTRYGINPMNEIPHDRRRTAVKDYDWGKAIDEKDLMRVATDPSHAYNVAGMASHRRNMDKAIIKGLTAPAYTGKGGETVVNFVGTNSGKITVGAVSNQAGHITADSRFAVTAGNYEGVDIAVNYTGGAAANSGITLAKLKAIKNTFLGTLALDQTELPLINVFLSRTQWEELLGINEIINGDFALRRRLEALEVTEWGGFRFFTSEFLPKSGTTRSCFAFLPRCGKLKLMQDITADMWRLSERKNIPYMYIKASFGFTRFWGECLARVNCHEAS